MDIRETLLMIPGIVVGFAFHEYAHAQTAVWLGDDTPRHQGRLSLNPAVHIDLLGFIFILLAGFGWAKPVEIDERNFKNPKRDDILVSLAGPFMNLLIAVFFLIVMKAMYYIPESVLSDTWYNTITEVFDYTVWMNIVLMVFNLIPIPPLDGSHVLFWITGLREKDIYYTLFSNGRIILPILIITNLIDKIITPPIIFIYDNLMRLFF